MYTTALTAEIARQHQAEMRRDARGWSLARLLRQPAAPTPRPAPTYGGITAVPTVVLQHRHDAQHRDQHRDQHRRAA